MKNNIIILVIALLIGCSAKKINKNPLNVNNHKIETYTFNSNLKDSLYFDVYIILSNSKFVYRKIDQSFVSEVDISINISDNETDKQILHKSFSEVFKENFYNNTRSIDRRSIIYKRFLLPKGQFKMFVFIEDNDSKNNWIINKKLIVEDFKSISNVIVKEKEDSKYNLLINNKIDSQDSIFCYFQLSDSLKIDDEKLSINIENKESFNFSLNSDSTLNNFYCLRLPINSFVSNNPKIEINISQFKKVISFKYDYKKIESIFPEPDLILEIMYFYGFIDNYKTIKNETNQFKYNFIRQYWLNTDKINEQEVSNLMIEFNSRIQYSIKHFSAIGPGWRSDRGRILINYGYPSHKEVTNNNENGYVYLVWYYSSGKKIIFIDQDGFGDYKIYREMY